MNVQAFLDALKRDPDYAGQLVHVHTEPACPAAWEAVPGDLRPELRTFLGALGITRLYHHQAEAVGAALAGQHLLVTTSAASGKSLCYQLPLLDALLSRPDTTALLIFPTKALARDQVAAWNRGVAAVDGEADPRALRAFAFDADAGPAERRLARQRARVLVTNPEMLHVALLPGHGRWARFFAGLEYVVLDEVHVYTGFFGANMANLLRRLQRVCRHHGAAPRFVCLSATVGNPVEMAQRLTGRELYHVARDASGRGGRTYAFWNPPKIKGRRWRGRRSANVEAHELMVRLVRDRVPTICFSKARNTAEMIYRYVRETLEREAPALAARVTPYRGGYVARERRELERRLRAGDLLGVSATRALELGVDVGMLEACIIVGYPGTLNAFLQQAGRAGRGGRDSLCILVGIDTPINQYIMQHPEYVFDRPVERAVVDCDNPFVILGHLRCTAAELPVPDEELPRFGYAAELAAEVLQDARKLQHLSNAWYHAAAEIPAHELRLRGYGDESTVIVDVDRGQVIDRVDKFRALRIFYPGAVYFHLGNTYAMVHHDFEKNVVQVRREELPYYTDPVTGTAVDHIDNVLEERPFGIGQASLGEVLAVLSTDIYERVRFYSLDRLSQHETHVPPVAYEAMAFWLTVPEDLATAVAAAGLEPESGMRGILYCVSRILPLFLTCDANDFDWSLGCRNSPWHTLFWFEFYARGIGHAEQCYARLEEIMPVALEHLLTCDCEDGCPNCTSRLITPYHVRNIELGEGTVHSRRTAAVVLNSLLTGQSVGESLELLAQPRPRGQRLLPAWRDDRRRREPCRLPVNERTRRLMQRKLERQRQPHEPVDHAIDMTPPVGIPSAEPERSLAESDASRRTGGAAVRQRGDPIARRLRMELRRQRSNSPGPAQAAEPQTAVNAMDGPGNARPESPPSLAGPPTLTPAEARTTMPPAPVHIGDSLARLARRRRRGAGEQPPGSDGPTWEGGGDGPAATSHENGSET